MPNPPDAIDLSAVPLFPLPNVVLFPRAVLPLHIFEERYKAMTAEALSGGRQIAMALLQPGWEKNYHGRAAVEPVVCVGTILTHEKLPDGRYNFLLHGHTRARIAREVNHDTLYRVAELEPLPEQPVLEIDLAEERRRLAAVFETPPLLATGIGRKFGELLASPLPTSDLADLIAFNFLEDIPLKQSLLADTDIRRRVGRIVQAFESLHAVLQSVPPHIFGRDPSLN